MGHMIVRQLILHSFNFVFIGHPGQGEEAKFLLVHARPYLLSFEPYSLSPWDLSITMNRQASMDGTHEVVGQVWNISNTPFVKCKLNICFMYSPS
jgi:hypothetical protein